MSRTSYSLAYGLRQEILKQSEEKKYKTITDNDTKRAYMKSINRFVEYASERNIRTFKAFSECDKVKLLQDYADRLKTSHTSSGKPYSPSTIHSYLAPICRASNVPMSLIDKPKRTSDHLTRSRSIDANEQGKNDVENPKNDRLVAFAGAVGIRRAEYKALTGADLTYMDGKLCVHVKRGKGGKEQFQVVLPEHEMTVCETFKNVGADEKVFADEELDNKIDLHAIRGKVAKESYNYYLTRLKNEPAYRKKLVVELKRYYRAMNDNRGYGYKVFCSELEKDTPYRLRGSNLQRARENGTPETYDRLALMAVNVFHLSHWRLGVGVTNYLV